MTIAPPTTTQAGKRTNRKSKAALAAQAAAAAAVAAAAQSMQEQIMVSDDRNHYFTCFECLKLLIHLLSTNFHIATDANATTTTTKSTAIHSHRRKHIERSDRHSYGHLWKCTSRL